MKKVTINDQPHTPFTEEEIALNENFDSLTNKKSTLINTSSLQNKLFWTAAAALVIGSAFYFLMPTNTDTSQVVANQIDSLFQDSVNTAAARVIYVDSLLKTTVDLPKVFNPVFIDSGTVNKFDEMAKNTNGEITIVASSSLIKKEVIHVLNSHVEEDADVLFLIDKTGSMADDLAFIKKGLDQIIATLKQHHVRLAIALYGDKNADGADWYSYQCFNYDYDLAYDFIKGIKVTGGDDYPESVYEGYFESQKENFWQSNTKRMIVLIGDAPPLEKPLSKYSMKDLIADANRNKIKMNFYPIVVSPAEEVPAAEMKKFQKMNLVNNLFPNPTTGEFTVDFGATNITRVEVYNAAAQLISTTKTNESQLKLNLNEQPNGLYIVRAYDLYNNYDERKVIVQKF